MYYSLIAFYGIISAKRAEKTNLTSQDVFLLDNTLIEAIPSEATTRSKIGQTPRLLLRVEYMNDFYIGDLRRYVKVKPKEGKRIDALREIYDFSLDVSRLIEILRTIKENIKRIYLWVHPELSIDLETLNELKNEFKDKIVSLPHKID